MIGGEHYLRPAHSVKNSMSHMLDNTAANVSYFATGRDALYSLLRALPQQTVHMPNLICTSVYQTCLQAGKKVHSYKVKPNLIHIEDFEPAKVSNSLLLVMHYFGLANLDLLHRAKSVGMTVVSDVTHMLFNWDQMRLISEQSDYLVASLRKSGPFPDGGFLSSHHYSVPSPSRGIREEFFSLRAAGLLSRGFSALCGFNNDENFYLIKKAEHLIDQSPVGDYQCSYYSQKLLGTINLDEAVEQISKNTTILFTLLQGCCDTVNTLLTPTPYYLCLFKSQDERDAVRQQLASKKCFCPIHWDTSQMPSPSSLSNHILSIPCDARYSEADMESVAKIISSCLKL